MAWLKSCAAALIGALVVSGPAMAGLPVAKPELQLPQGAVFDRAGELRQEAWAALRNDDWRRAKAIAREWSAIDPANDFPWVLRAWAEAERNDYLAVVQAYNRAIDLNPDQRNAVWRSLGVAYTALGRHDYAVDVYRRAAQMNPADPRGWVDLCDAQLRNRDPQAAVEAAREALRREADHAEAWACRGQSLMQQGKLEDALAAYRQAIDGKTFDPATDRTSFWFALGTVYHRLQREDGMREAMEGMGRWNTEVAERFRRAYLPGEAAAVR